MPFDPCNCPVSHTFISNCLAQVVHQDGTGSAGYRRMLDYIGISIDTGKSVMILFHFGYTPTSRNVKLEETNYNELADRFYSIVMEQFGQNIMCDAIFLGNYLYVHIFNPRSDHDTEYPNSLTPKYSDLIATCRRIIRISEEELCIDVKAAIGRMVHRSITDTTRLLIDFLRFQNFLESRDNTFVEPDNGPDMKHLLLFPDSRLFPLIQNFMQAVSDTNEQGIKDFVDQLVQCILEKNPRTLAEFQVVFCQSFSPVVSSLMTLNLPMADFDCFDFSRLFSISGTITAFKEELVTTLLSFSKQYASSNNRSINEIVAYVREQLTHRFTDPQLSVSGLAEEVGISQPYLSSQFAQCNGIGLLAFIHRCRIDEAKKLMETTELTLQEISERVGYGHASTMYRSFRKYEGTTPGIYRSRLAPSDTETLSEDEVTAR